MGIFCNKMSSKSFKRAARAITPPEDYTIGGRPRLSMRTP